MENEKFYCTVCGAELTEKNMHNMTLCKHCLDDYFNEAENEAIEDFD